VVNQSKEEGDFKAIPVKRTVQRGKRVVATEAVLEYTLNALDPKLSFSSAFADA
jgi:hypothetical protein